MITPICSHVHIVLHLFFCLQNHMNMLRFCKSLQSPGLSSFCAFLSCGICNFFALAELYTHGNTCVFSSVHFYYVCFRNHKSVYICVSTRFCDFMMAYSFVSQRVIWCKKGNFLKLDCSLNFFIFVCSHTRTSAVG